jgi:hypothetical protein
MRFQLGCQVWLADERIGSGIGVYSYPELLIFCLKVGNSCIVIMILFTVEASLHFLALYSILAMDLTIIESLPCVYTWLWEDRYCEI